MKGLSSPWSIPACIENAISWAPSLQAPSTSGLPTTKGGLVLETVSFKPGLLREEKEMITDLTPSWICQNEAPISIRPPCCAYLDLCQERLHKKIALTESEFKNNYINNKYVKLHLKQ